MEELVLPSPAFSIPFQYGSGSAITVKGSPFMTAHAVFLSVSVWGDGQTETSAAWCGPAVQKRMCSLKVLLHHPFSGCGKKLPLWPWDEAGSRQHPLSKNLKNGGTLAMKDRVNDHSKYQLWIDPNRVIPYTKNAKEHTDKQIENICTSIRKYGWQQDAVITTDYVLVIGHGRRLAAIKLGCELPYHLIDKKADELTDEDIRELRIADNQTNAETGFDFDILEEEIADLDFDGFDFDFGFDDDEEETEKEVVEDDFDPEPPEEAKSKLGDIYQLGTHRLMCGDSTDVESVRTLTGGCLMDMLITDPPYNVDYEGATKDALKIMNDNMEDAEFRKFLSAAFFAADCVMKPGAAFYIWHADSEGYNFRGACRDIEWTVRQCLIWVKNSLVLGRQDYQLKHEPCLYGWKDGASHEWFSDRRQTTTLEFDRPTRSELHPTMKPVPLFDYQIKNSTQKGECVLDLFGGSGTTIMACEQDGRRAFCMELDPKYVDVIIKRWEDFTGEKAVLLNGR